jgi:hypothetical protein
MTRPLSTRTEVARMETHGIITLVTVIASLVAAF